MNENEQLEAQVRTHLGQATADFPEIDAGAAQRLDLLRETLRETPPPAADVDCLLVCEGGTRKWVVLSGPAVLGAGPDCTIRLASPYVSQRHCRLFREGDSWHVEDLGAKNGVLVNGQPVPRKRLCDGDTIQLADVTLVLLERDEPVQP